MMNEVSEFEGKELEIDCLRRLIYKINKDVKESESVYYELENIDNTQEISLRHMHNVLNGFRYLNTIDLSSFKYAEYARAIEIAEKIESSLDALFTSEVISDDTKNEIVAALNSVQFQNAPRSLQSTKSRLEEKVRLVKDRTEKNSKIDTNVIARLKPGFFERLIKSFIKYIDSKRSKGLKENDIYNKEDNIHDSYQTYKKEEEAAAAEAARLAAEKEAADAEQIRAATETIKSAVKEVVVNARKGLHALGEALHLVSSQEKTQKSDQLQALHKMSLDNRDISESVPKQLAKKKQANINKAKRREKQEKTKAERKLKKEAEKTLKKSEEKQTNAQEIEITSKETKTKKQEQLLKLKEMGELRDVMPESIETKKQSVELTVARENIEQQTAAENTKQREVEQILKAQDQKMRAEAKQQKQEQLIKLKEMEALKSLQPKPLTQEKKENIEEISAPATNTAEAPSIQPPKDKQDVKQKPKLEKSPGTMDLKEKASKPKLERSPGAMNLKESTSKATTVSEKKAGFFTKGEKIPPSKKTKTKKESKKRLGKNSDFK